MPSPPLTPAVEAACATAMHVYTADGQWLKAGRAWLFILARVGWPLTASVLGLPVMIQCVELGYRFVARNRMLVSRFLFTRE